MGIVTDSNGRYETCYNCKYYQPYISINSSKDGICRRFPPKIIVLGDEIISLYPDVKSTDYCGEFPEKEGE